MPRGKRTAIPKATKALARTENREWLRKVSQPTRRQFLVAYATCFQLQKAAAAVGINYVNHYQWMHDEDYKEAFGLVEKWKLGYLEDEAIHRATVGEVRYKFDSKGKAFRDPVTKEFYVEKVKSDALLSQQLKAADKTKYADRNETTGADGSPLAIQLHAVVQELSAMSDAELMVIAGKPITE